MRPWQTPLDELQTNDHVYATLVLKAVLRPFQGICEIGTIFPTQRTWFATPILSQVYSQILPVLYDT